METVKKLQSKEMDCKIISINEQWKQLKNENATDFRNCVIEYTKDGKKVRNFAISYSKSIEKGMECKFTATKVKKDDGTTGTILTVFTGITVANADDFEFEEVEFTPAKKKSVQQGKVLLPQD